MAVSRPDGADGAGFDANQLAALHRGLLALLTVAVLMLMPIILWAGASGRAWTEAKTRLPLLIVSRSPAGTPEPPLARVPRDGGAMSDGLR